MGGASLAATCALLALLCLDLQLLVGPVMLDCVLQPFLIEVWELAASW